MNLVNVMKEVSNQADTIAGLRMFAFPPPTLTPPAGVVAYPDTIDFDLTGRRGKDRMKLPMWVVVGKASDRAARDALGAYCDGAGAKSVKQVLESGTYTTFDTLRVESIDFEVVTIGAVDYLGALFTLDISGSGN